MGDIVVTEFVSVDGVMEDPGGAEGFQHGGWAFLFDRGDEQQNFKLEETRASDALLLGRRTYEMVAAAMTTGAGRCDDTVARRVTPQPGLYGKRVSQIGLITLACLVLGVDRRMRHARIFEVHHGGRRARRARGECWLRGQAGRVVGHGGEAGQRT